MKLKVELSEDDIHKAIADWVSKETGGTCSPENVRLHYTNFDGSPDPRERSYHTANAEYVTQ